MKRNQTKIALEFLSKFLWQLLNDYWAPVYKQTELARPTCMNLVEEVGAQPLGLTT